MTRSKDALVNDILTESAHLLSDMGRQQLPKDRIPGHGFTDYSKIFCDSIIFWGLYNGRKESKKGTTIGKYIAELREIFEDADMDVESIMMTHTGLLDDHDITVSKKVRKRHRKQSHGKYVAKYTAIKVSLNYCRLGRTVRMLDNVQRQLAKKCIVLHDIDFAQDCGNITMRQQLEKHIREQNAGIIIQDRKKVGDNCVSWKGNQESTKNIRFKVYNKFVQQLESAEVRKSLGSRMENLVEKEGKFAKHLQRYEDCGFSRLELTFYGSKLLSTSAYREQMQETREMLDSCKTFKCSHIEQWQQRAEAIESMVAVYFPKMELFAYCHWWNAITSKKYGYTWKKVPRPLVQNLLANFSFNDRPIYFFEADVVDDHACISKTTVYERVHGSTAMTMVAGSHKGMFPSRESHGYNVHKFADIGLVEVDNISIGWPKKKVDKRSSPIADIVERQDDGNNKQVGHLNSIHGSSYTAIYNILQPNIQYTVVAAGMASFRKQREWHFITDCGLKVRGGLSFRKVWNTWRHNFLGDDALSGSVRGVECMTFIAVRKIRVKGKDDMECRVVK